MEFNTATKTDMDRYKKLYENIKLGYANTLLYKSGITNKGHEENQ